MLYAKWDIEADEFLSGPVNLHSNNNTLTEAEFNDMDWFRCERAYTHEPFQSDYQDVVGVSAVKDGNVITLTYATEWKPLEELVTIIGERINRSREHRIVSGFTYGGIKFDSDEAARTNITGSVTTINSGLLVEASNPDHKVLPEHIEWTVFDNSSVNLTPFEMIDIGLRMSVWHSGVYGAARKHKDILLTITDPVELATYDYSGEFWPTSDIGGVISSLSED